MAEIKDFNKLLEGMNPELASKEFVYSTISEIQLSRLKLDPLLIFKEKEGITVITERRGRKAPGS